MQKSAENLLAEELLIEVIIWDFFLGEFFSELQVNDLQKSYKPNFHTWCSVEVVLSYSLLKSRGVDLRYCRETYETIYFFHFSQKDKCDLYMIKKKMKK